MLTGAAWRERGVDRGYLGVLRRAGEGGWRGGLLRPAASRFLDIIRVRPKEGAALTGAFETS